MVLSKLLEGKGSFGWDAATGEYGDLVQMGVIDPTKVTRYALQNAASVAGLILTTDAMVAELPKDEKPAPTPHGGGDMDYRSGAARKERDTAPAGSFLVPLPARQAAPRVSDGDHRRWSWAAPHSRAAAAREILCR